MNSPITYYGGKKKMLNIILPLIPKHTVYTESFLGGASVFFAKDPVRNETLNDTLDLIVNFYEVLQNDWNELVQKINATLISRFHFNLANRIIKRRYEFSTVEYAWAFWFLSNFSYMNKIGGGLKYSNCMQTSLPRSLKNKKLELVDQMKSRIENAYVEKKDAIWVLKSRNVPGAFHFIDPPYMNADQGHYSGYSLEDYEKLLLFLPEIKGKFMLTNYPSDLLDTHIELNGWNVLSKEYKNKGVRKDNRPKTEMIITNFQKEQTLFS